MGESRSQRLCRSHFRERMWESYEAGQTEMVYGEVTAQETSEAEAAAAEEASQSTAVTKMQSALRGKARRKSLAAKKHAARMRAVRNAGSKKWGYSV